jgi:hypothetical protein
MKKHIVLISIGFINVIHASIHGLQFIQSMILFSYSVNGEKTWIHKILDNPFTGLLWGVLGLITIFIGYKDFKHHKNKK